jgi:hypothetical protein
MANTTYVAATGWFAICKESGTEKYTAQPLAYWIIDEGGYAEGVTFFAMQLTKTRMTESQNPKLSHYCHESELTDRLAKLNHKFQ